MPKDKETNIDSLKQKVKEFCDKRDWDQFHDMKELSVGMIIEAAELLEHFRWKTKKEVQDTINDPDKRSKIEEEVADVLYFILRISQLNNVDLTEALEKKLKKNEEKYPVDKFKGSNRKYNE